ncbi:MAG: hypothetical protein HYU36_04140 [Planctomycetes bacterium]|nr:hypothetical protein [Planctomycetota bacterium]
MFRNVILLSIVGFWAVMTAALVHREWQAGRDAAVGRGYAAILRPELVDSEAQMGMYLQGERVGVTHTLMRRLESHYEMDNWTRVGLPVLGPDRLNFHTKVRVGQDLRLQDVTGELTFSSLTLRMDGKVRGEELQLQFWNGGERVFEQTIPCSDEDLFTHLFSPFTPIPELKPGQSWKIRMFHPLTRDLETATATAEVKEELILGGQVFQVVRVRVKAKSMEALAWVTPEGVVLKQWIPSLGLMLLKEDTTRGED